MTEEIIEVTIRPDGKVEMHVKGIEGMACLEVTEELQRLLGGDIERQELTQDAYVGTTEHRERQQWT